MSRKGFLRMREKDYSNPFEWEERLFFSAMNNRDVARMTKGEFRVDNNPDGTHPVFILQQVERGAYQFCPCSTKEYNRGRASYIRKGSRTTPNGFRVERDSYILHFLTMNLTADSPLVERLPMLGRVEEDDIVGDYHKRGAKK